MRAMVYRRRPYSQDNAGNVKSWRTITVSTALSWLMRLLMTGLAPYEVYKGELLFAVATIVAVVISLVPAIVERNYRITLPFELDFLLTFSIFIHTFLGEGMEFYERFWFLDKSLHFFTSAVIGLIAFVTVYTLYYTRKLPITIPLVGFITVMFTMGVGGLWEIGEYAADNLFGKTTQGGLDDTMLDMIYDLIGGVIVSLLGMLYVRYSRPETRKRLVRPIGEIFGLGRRIDRIREGLRQRDHYQKDK
jgi:hypothetical protein